MNILNRISGITLNLGRALGLKAYICSLILLAALASPVFAQNDVLVIDPTGKIIINVNGVSIDLVEYLVPVGSIQPFAGGSDKVPDGWELCDGSSVSSSDPKYARLYAVIGTTFGNGSKTGSGQAGTGNFNLPDLRGRFIRGVDQGVGRDPDRAARTPMIDGGQAGDTVGSLQQDALQTHQHNYSRTYNPYGTAAYNGGYWFDWGNDALAQTLASTDPLNSRNSSETRPKNMYVNFIIKL
jgi:microcystin-dependent protein